jgi:DNA-directed RNA polymerase specialized sigma24 family protein
MRDATALFDRSARLPDLDPDLEASLVERVRQGDSEAFLRLAENYAPRLRAAAAHARGAIEDRSERQQATLTAFHSAVLATKPGGRVATVIKLVMTNEMTRAASEVRRGLSVPHGTARRYFAILGSAGGDVRAAASAAPAQGMTTDAFQSVRAAVHGGVSVETLVALDDGAAGTALDRRLAVTYEPVTHAGAVERQVLAQHALAAIEGVERAVTLLAFGFSEPEPVADAEIAHRLGINRTSAWKIKQRALAKMRASLGA